MKRNLQTDFLGAYSLSFEEKEDFRVRLKDCIKVSVLEDGVYPRHKHIVNEIQLLESGAYSCNLDGAHVSLKPGELLLVQTGQTHEDFFTKGSVLYAFHFVMLPNAEALGFNSIFKKEVKPEQQIIDAKEMGLETLIGLLRHENSSNPTNAFRLDNAIFEVIFRKILSSFPTEVLHEQFQQQIVLNRDALRLTRIFDKYAYDMPTLEELCRAVAMSRSNFHRLTQRLYVLPPCKAFMRYKMMRIKAYMQENFGLTVRELGDIFGFSSQSHFSWAFHKEFGVYPREMLKKAHEA